MIYDLNDGFTKKINNLALIHIPHDFIFVFSDICSSYPKHIANYKPQHCYYYQFQDVLNLTRI